MSAESPGAFNQASSYGAEQTRRAIFSWAARTSANSPGIISGGLLSASDCQLSAPGSGLSVNLSTGEALIGGSEGGTQGGYYGRISSTTNLALSTANPTNPRIDTVSLTIADAGYTEPSGVSGNALVPLVTTGTPTSGATLSNLSGKASLPLSSLLLGYVLVPASATNIITADIANVASPAAPGAPGLWALQLLSAQKLQMQVGTVGAVWAGTSLAQNVNHSLGRTPQIVLISQLQASASGVSVTYQVPVLGSTLFTLQGQASTTVTGTINVGWMAIG